MLIPSIDPKHGRVGQTHADPSGSTIESDGRDG